MPNIPDNTPLWFTILIFLGMGLLAFMQMRNMAGKQRSESKLNDAEAVKKISETKLDDAEAARKIGEMYSELLDDVKAAFNKRIDDMQADIDYLKLELKKYRNWTAGLIKQLREHDIMPIEPPDTGELNKDNR